MVDDKIVKSGKYHANEQFARWLGINVDKHSEPKLKKSCGMFIWRKVCDTES